MRALVVGGDGLIGAAIAKHLGIECVATTRRYGTGRVHLDLLSPPDVEDMPILPTAFLCAGINGMRECELNAGSWRVNVDGVIAVAKLLLCYHCFLVYVSSNAVEWSDAAYARQRAAVESFLMARTDPAIIRAQKITAGNVDQFAAFAVGIGEKRAGGVHHWP